MRDLVIEFDPPPDWAPPYFVHFFDTWPSNRNTDWPGRELTREQRECAQLLLPGVERTHLVFSDAAGRQSRDLECTRSGLFQWSGSDFVFVATATGETFHAASQDRVSFAAPPRAPRAVMSGPDFREETIYFVLTARFYDGDPSNNYFCRDRIRFDAAGNASDPHWRGDFKGLIAKLDYIAELGFTAIWITPPIENRSGLDYHGYHGYDWTKIDPRLESPGATYQDLIYAVHAIGMKLIQDVVVNHSCQYGIRDKVFVDHLPVKYYVPAGAQQGALRLGPYQGNLGDYRSPMREDNDNPAAPDWYRERQTTDPEGKLPLRDPKTGTVVPCPGYSPGRFFGVDVNQLDSTWYHQEGFISGPSHQTWNDFDHLARATKN